MPSNAERIAAPDARPIIVGSVLYGHDAAVAELVRSMIPHMRDLEWGPCVALGVFKDGRIVGGVVFNNYRGFDIHISAAFEKGWASRGAIRQLCAYPFEDLNVRRVTAVVGVSNKPAQKALKALGFVQEGACKRGLDGKETALIYGLLKERCRFLRKNHVVRLQAASRS